MLKYVLLASCFSFLIDAEIIKWGKHYPDGGCQIHNGFKDLCPGDKCDLKQLSEGDLKTKCQLDDTCITQIGNFLNTHDIKARGIAYNGANAIGDPLVYNACPCYYDRQNERFTECVSHVVPIERYFPKEPFEYKERPEIEPFKVDGDKKEKEIMPCAQEAQKHIPPGYRVGYMGKSDDAYLFSYNRDAVKDDKYKYALRARLEEIATKCNSGQPLVCKEYSYGNGAPCFACGIVKKG